jgi:hypothetical protein
MKKFKNNMTTLSWPNQKMDMIRHYHIGPELETIVFSSRTQLIEKNETGNGIIEIGVSFITRKCKFTCMIRKIIAYEFFPRLRD